MGGRGRPASGSMDFPMDAGGRKQSASAERKDKLSGGRGSRSSGQTADRGKSEPGDRVYGNRIRSGAGRCV